MARPRSSIALNRRRRALWMIIMNDERKQEIYETLDRLEVSINSLTKGFSSLRRDMYDVQGRLTDAEAMMRAEHAALREDCNELFSKINTIESERTAIDAFSRDASDILNEIALDRVPGWEAA